MEAPKPASELWIFGYGSLIWHAGFAFRERRSARLSGWARRFWQGSHDHRGTPDAPGRVVTLVADAEAVCTGVAFRVAPDVFAYLDHREKNGYERHPLEIEVTRDDGRLERRAAVTYIAPSGNHAELGPAPIEAIAAQIARCEGPSGTNRDYLLRLADALRELGTEDDHVSALESALLAHEAATADRTDQL